MSINTGIPSNDILTEESRLSTSHQRRRTNRTAPKAGLILIVFLLGLGSGYLAGRQTMRTDIAQAEASSKNRATAMFHQINPPEGYVIPATFGNIGPQMLAAGAIDLDQFSKIYQQANQPLTGEQMAILTVGSVSRININNKNAYFLLNFFWALGLTNQNPVLTEGPMMAEGRDQAGNYASTSGWTIGAKPSTELYASKLMISLTSEEQARLLEVATTVFRPCCDNPTHFPDCNHGMAMLGLLELMASQDATVEEMFDAAKYANAFWYPQKMIEIATYLKVGEKVDFGKADSRQVVSSRYSSGSGFQAVHQWLAANSLLEQNPSSGASCGV